MPSAIDPTKPIIVNPTTQSVRDNFQAAKDEIEALQAVTTDLTFAGVLSSFAGNLVVNGLTQIDDAVTLTKAPGDSSLAIASTAYVDLALGVHEAAADPHPGVYLTQVAADGLYDPLGAALSVDNRLTTHINAVDAHPIYLTVPEADVLFDVIGAANTVNNALLAHEADVSVHFADAPADGTSYSRQDNDWVAGGAGGGYVQQDVTPLAPLPDSGWWDTEDGEAFRYYDNGGNPVYVREDPGAGGGGGAAPGPGDGDVVGPGAAVHDNIAAFNGTTGKLIKDGGAPVSSLATAANLNAHIASANPHTESVGSAQETGTGLLINNFVTMTQAQYDASAQNPTTIYVIIG